MSTLHAVVSSENQTPLTDRIRVEELRTVDQMNEVERIQSEVWGADVSWTVPSHLLQVAAEDGGIVLGAYAEDQLVGFVFGLLGRKDGRLLHVSHMLGILPEYRGMGIGTLLKETQRRVATAQGLDCIVWTFDPLEARNSYLNLHKLGATSRTYRVDYYGAMRDAVNHGLPSDRLIAEWDLHSTGRPNPPSTASPLILPTEEGLILNLAPLAAGDPVCIPVPGAIHELRRGEASPALQWRLLVRSAFLSAFERGYIALDFRDGAHILSLPAAQSS